MKSFVAYPLDFEKMLFPETAESNFSGRLIAHYELYKRISYLKGTVVKCGISAKEGLTRLALFQSLINSKSSGDIQQVIAFEKVTRELYAESENGQVKLEYKNPDNASEVAVIKELLSQEGFRQKMNFYSGNLGDSIPGYLMEHPELKISFLNIDLDDYEAAFTALQFFYPRVMHGGLIVFDNYYKQDYDFRAVNDFFATEKIIINNFSINKGPHYLVRS